MKNTRDPFHAPFLGNRVDDVLTPTITLNAPASAEHRTTSRRQRALYVRSRGFFLLLLEEDLSSIKGSDDPPRLITQLPSNTTMHFQSSLTLALGALASLVRVAAVHNVTFTNNCETALVPTWSSGLDLRKGASLAPGATAKYVIPETVRCG